MKAALYEFTECLSGIVLWWTAIPVVLCWVVNYLEQISCQIDSVRKDSVKI